MAGDVLDTGGSLSRALRDTWASIKTWWFGIAFSMATVGTPALFIPFIYGRDRSGDTVAFMTVGFALGGALFVVVLLCVVQAARAPYRQRAEARVRVQQLLVDHAAEVRALTERYEARVTAVQEAMEGMIKGVKADTAMRMDEQRKDMIKYVSNVQSNRDL
jgi:hypothetical protein